MRPLHLLALATAIAASGAACGSDDGANGPSNTDPVADFTVQCILLACSFLDASSDPDAGDAVAGWNWNFGDNSGPVTASDPDHAYPAAGTYNVTLTVIDQNGGDGSVTKQVVVTTTPPVTQPSHEGGPFRR